MSKNNKRKPDLKTRAGRQARKEDLKRQEEEERKKQEKREKVKEKVKEVIKKGAQAVWDGTKWVVQQVAGTAIKTVGSIAGKAVSKFFNHDSWLEHYPDEGTININYLSNKGSLLPMTGKIVQGGLERNSVPNALSYEAHFTVPNDSLNQWKVGIARLKSSCRKANGALKWTAQDLDHYIINKRAIIVGLATIKRAVKTLNYFKSTDNTVPSALFAAYGLDYDDWNENSNDIIKCYNSWARQVAIQMNLHLDLFERSEWLISNVFRDSDDAKASYLCVYPREVPYYDPADQSVFNAQFGNVDVSLETTGMSWSSIKDQMNALIDIIVTDNTFQDISGDILKAWGEEEIRTPELLDINSVLETVYDEEALTQFQNASIPAEHLLALVNEGTDTDFTESTVMLTRFVGNQAANGFISNVLSKVPVNSYVDKVTPTLTKKFTYETLAAAGSWQQVEGKDAIEVFVGDVVFTDCFVIFRSEDSEFYNEFTIAELGWRAILWEDVSTEIYDTVSAWSAVDFCPMTTCFTRDAGSGKIDTFGVMWDWNNYALASPTDIETLHGQVILSLLYKKDLIKQANAATN